MPAWDRIDLCTALSAAFGTCGDAIRLDFHARWNGSSWLGILCAATLLGYGNDFSLLKKLHGRPIAVLRVAATWFRPRGTCKKPR